MHYDVIIIGAGAAGLMCAIEAGKRGRSVLVLERNQSVGEKIRISGGGRCNFTNTEAGHTNYLSGNPHFCKSALARFTADNLIDLVVKYEIAFHEKKLGQLFCDESAEQIIEMLKKECGAANVTVHVGCDITDVSKDDRFHLKTSKGDFTCASLVIATGGLSIPQLGATNFAFALARQFGIGVTKLRPGLVPLTFKPDDIRFFGSLAGISVDVTVTCGEASFRENILFTHRGMSGPGILQTSSYWEEGSNIIVNLLPELDAEQILLENEQSKKELSTVLDQYLPRRFVLAWCERLGGSKPLYQYKKKDLERIAYGLQHWVITPSGTEGFGNAEVTVGGLDTEVLSSKTMQTHNVRGLFF
ncbi:MAG: NAD(P)/FAD-dependent oxidoreductase, partial [Ignavibacteriales bacterium]|nr:NAD(P)/FAD-dependent oxidoreductase [Ignavibacteriales bacterium]